ncbi:MAG: hypothetical protein LBP72_01305 [Dysgonamonadaceae bacterium]|jgi:hypothetical protein|nr:hypothetical protein [Dysgonamonadaceae bacterium]
MKNEIELKQLWELLPAYVCLYSVGYNENLNMETDLLQSCVTDNSLDRIYEYVDDAYMDCEAGALLEYMEELEETVSRRFEIGEDEARRLVFERYEDEIRNRLYEKDGGLPVEELLANTQSFSIFMDTGLEIVDGSWRWTRSEQTLWMDKIKRKLNITGNQWDDNIREMLLQASYGGRLVVYFYGSVKSLIHENEKDWKSVSFTSPAIAVINTGNGSGSHTHLMGHSFSMPFRRENLFIDKYFKYNYVSAVCGMYQDWCEASKAVFSFDKIPGKKSAASSLAAQALQDRKYAEIYRKGKCSWGDMDITRHRDVYYRNDFPCGNKCPHCGTFWID